jgi:hypothetical protein
MVRSGAARNEEVNTELLLDIREGLALLASAMTTYLERHAPLRTGRPRKKKKAASG